MKKYLFSFLVLFVFCTITSVSAQTIRYVKEGGPGNGFLWSAASADFQAIINAVDVEQVSVAKGTYQPLVNGSFVGDQKDLDGSPRVQGGTIEMRAYEFQGDPVILINPDANNILYVNKNVIGGDGSGNSWANAIPELADALKYARLQNAITPYTSANPLQMFVVKGTYKPLYSPADDNFGNDAGRDNSFLMVKNVQLYGGFAGTETSLSDRELSTCSILSGDIGTNQSGRAHHVVIFVGEAGTAELNGFSISGGDARSGELIVVSSKNTGESNGGGICIESSSPILTNLTVESNFAHDGGGIYISSSSPVLTNVKINNNTVYL